MQGDDRVSRYRGFAVACLELARCAGDPSKRALYVSMAQNWIELTKHDFSPELEKALDIFNNDQLGFNNHQLRAKTDQWEGRHG